MYLSVLYAADEGPRAETSCTQLLINLFDHNQFAYSNTVMQRLRGGCEAILLPTIWTPI